MNELFIIRINLLFVSFSVIFLLATVIWMVRAPNTKLRYVLISSIKMLLSFCNAEHHRLEFGLYHQELYKIAFFCLSILHKDEQVCVWWGRKASYHKNSFGNVSRTYNYEIWDCSNFYLLMRGKCASFLPNVLCSLLLLKSLSTKQRLPTVSIIFIEFVSHIFILW